MRRLVQILAIMFITALVASGAGADEPPAPSSSVRVWEGYLWKTDEGLEIGWPVVAKGVLAAPAHVVECPDREKLTPLISTMDESYVFWNYTLEEPLAEALEKLPKVLVRVRGPVSQAEVDVKTRAHSAPLRMKPAEILSVEFVNAKWLAHWSPLFRETTSPWHIHDIPKGDPAKTTKVLAPKVAAALRRMRGVPGPTTAQKKAASNAAPEAQVVTRFRERTEQGILHWLQSVNEKFDLGLDLADLGPTPPSGMELRRWFLDSPKKADFLAKVRSAWKGDLGLLVLPNYVVNNRSTVWTETAVDDVEAWDAATYAQRRGNTIRIVGG